MDENAKNNVGSDNYGQDEATEKELGNLVNILQNNITLSFGNVEGMSEEEKSMIKDIIDITEHKLEDELNGFKKVDRNLLKDRIGKVNGILKEIKSDNITGTNRLTKACAIFVGRKVGFKPNQIRANAAKES